MAAWTAKANAKGKGEGGEFEKPPAGNHRAVLVAMIDMGSQRQEPYETGGKVTFPHRIYWCWELCDEAKSGSSEKHVIGLDLTFSLHEKAKMRGFCESRANKKIPDGLEYDITQELGQGCLLNVIEKNGYPKIESVSAMPKGMAKPEATYPLTLIGFDELKSGTKTIPDWVPWLYGEDLMEHVKRAKEWSGAASPAPAKSAAKPAPTPAPAKTPETSGDKWDYTDGVTVGVGKTTAEVIELLKGVDPTKVKVKIHKQPKETAQTAAEWGCFSEHVEATDPAEVPW